MSDLSHVWIHWMPQRLTNDDEHERRVEVCGPAGCDGWRTRWLNDGVDTGIGLLPYNSCE